MAHQRETIQVKYADYPVVHVKTCLTAEQASALRERWPDGVVMLEMLGDTPLLTTEAARSWFVRAVCTILKIDDWRRVDRECTGRERYAPPLKAAPELFSMPMHLATAKKAQPVRAPRVGRIERTRNAARPASRSRATVTDEEQAEAAALQQEVGLVARPVSRAELEDLRATARVKGAVEAKRRRA
jgi:hypothetical protein